MTFFYAYNQTPKKMKGVAFMDTGCLMRVDGTMSCRPVREAFGGGQEFFLKYSNNTWSDQKGQGVLDIDDVEGARALMARIDAAKGAAVQATLISVSGASPSGYDLRLIQMIKDGTKWKLTYSLRLDTKTRPPIPLGTGQLLFREVSTLAPPSSSSVKSSSAVPPSAVPSSAVPPSVSSAKAPTTLVSMPVSSVTPLRVIGWASKAGQVGVVSNTRDLQWGRTGQVDAVFALEGRQRERLDRADLTYSVSNKTFAAPDLQVQLSAPFTGTLYLMQQNQRNGPWVQVAQMDVVGASAARFLGADRIHASLQSVSHSALTSSSVLLTWSGAKNVAYSVVSWNGTNSAKQTGSSYQVNGLNANSSYTFTVTPYNSFNEAGAGKSVTIKTLLAPVASSRVPVSQSVSSTAQGVPVSKQVKTPDAPMRIIGIASPDSSTGSIRKRPQLTFASSGKGIAARFRVMFAWGNLDLEVRHPSRSAPDIYAEFSHPFTGSVALQRSELLPMKTAAPSWVTMKTKQVTNATFVLFSGKNWETQMPASMASSSSSTSSSKPPARQQITSRTVPATSSSSVAIPDGQLLTSITVPPKTRITLRAIGRQDDVLENPTLAPITLPVNNIKYPNSYTVSPM